MNIMEKNFKRISKEDVLEVLRSVLQSPNEYANDPVLNKIAGALLPKPSLEGAEISLNKKEFLSMYSAANSLNPAP